MATFKLSKWYFDCVTSSGDISLAYSAQANWAGVHLHYSSLLETTGERVHARHSLRAQDSPKVASDAIFWHSSTLGATGAWEADALALRHTLLRTEEGSVEWNCLAPRAHAKMGNRAGLGYVEHLEMTIAPWKLPIEELLWGRFHGGQDWIVWIDWRGSLPQRVVYRNGESVVARSVGDAKIEFQDGSVLTMDRSAVIRNGPLGHTVLSAIPGIRKTLPARVLQVQECKWRSRARLERVGEPIVEGWAVHERVSWPP